MGEVALITVVHDPNGKSTELFNQLRPELERLYSELFITISDETPPLLIKTLESSSFQTKLIPKRGAAHARRETVALGLTGDSDYFHYCDFDRILAWAKNHLSELKEVVKDITNHHYLILGRTERAFQSHPEEWIETEKITNRICSLELGSEVDITAGSCAFSRKIAQYIKQYSKEKMTDAEWAMIVDRIANMQVDYRTVNGLEYIDDINKSNELNDSEAWLSRLRLSFIISDTTVNVGKQKR